MHIDDFGAGFSTLAYLRDLPELDGVKLDRSFGVRIAEDGHTAAIVESTVRLADSLGLALIAEGVETESARIRLADVGCRLGQGTLFAPPASAADLSFQALPERA